MPRRRAGQRRRVRRARPGRAARTDRRRGLRAGRVDQPGDLPGHRQDHQGGAGVRRGRGAPRLRLPGRERRLRPRGRGGRPDLDRPPARGYRGARRQGPGPAHRAGGRGTAHPRHPGPGPGRRGGAGLRPRVRLPGGDQGRVRRRRARAQGGLARRGGRGPVRVGGAGGHRGVRPGRVLRGAVPGPAAARGDAVPGRYPRARGGDLDQGLLAAAQAPEAGRGGAGAVPDRGADRNPLPVLQGHPAAGGLHRRGYLRVPRRAGRHDQLPRGQHQAAGRAPGQRGGHRHRPGPGDVPHRRGRAARLRRPARPRALDRVPDQRRGPGPQLPARPGHDHRVESCLPGPAYGSILDTRPG